MRVIFVGIHNKPNLKPLCPSTKTGKLINRIIDKLPDIEVKKTNLFEVEYFPSDVNERIELQIRWYWTNLPVNDDIIVLLGNCVHNHFIHDCDNIIKLAHPSSMWSNEDKDNYVKQSSEKIINKIDSI